MKSKLPIIIKREYLNIVKKTSFIVVTLLGPIILASIFIIPIYISQINEEQISIGVVDETGFIYKGLQSNATTKYTLLYQPIDEAKKLLDKEDYDAILYIPSSFINSPETPRIWSKNTVSQNVMNNIESALKSELEKHRLAIYGINNKILEEINADVRVNNYTYKGGVEKAASSTVASILGFVMAIIIYFFVFMYGSMVLRSVMEEKLNRIVEVIISSVKSIHLLIGKIVAVLLVGLTQFLTWIILTLLIIIGVQQAFPDLFKYAEPEAISFQTKGLNPAEAQQLANAAKLQESPTNNALIALSNINIPMYILLFLFYFVFGYLIYSTLFAAIGAAVDNQDDTNQFMLPITIPLILAIIRRWWY
jgi:ABC-2 type transport system permease protein